MISLKYHHVVYARLVYMYYITEKKGSIYNWYTSKKYENRITI